jgi:hypothetical protein
MGSVREPVICCVIGRLHVTSKITGDWAVVNFHSFAAQAYCKVCSGFVPYAEYRVALWLNFRLKTLNMLYTPARGTI